MGSRSRRRRDGDPVPPPADGKPPSRSELRDAEARAALQPLAPGERPRAVAIGALVAAVIGIANLGFLFAGWEIGDEEPSPIGVVVFAGLMLVAAWGMWNCRYWAVLGFQCLLALSAVLAGLSLLVASNLRGAILASSILIGSGTLFWFLVKALARIQMPQRPDKVRRHG